MGLKIAVGGALGRMGRRIVAISLDRGHTITHTLDAHMFGKDYSEQFADGRVQTVIQDAYDGGADVMIDFSLPDGFSRHLEQCIKHKTPFVSGITGLNDDQHKALAEAAKTIPVLWAPNMSVGVNVLLEVVRDATKRLGDDYDIEITEMHHRRKVDAPSGTALALLNSVCEGAGRDPNEVVRHGREGTTGERTQQEIGMHSLRGGDVVGDHTVMFAVDGERLEFTHKASSRDTFARGAVRAAEWIHDKPKGSHTMKQVLGL